MPYNPAGLFSLIASYFATPGATIRTEQHNPVFEDVASALSSVLLRDGRAPMTGPLNMNGQPINNVVAGSSSGSVATLAQSTPIGALVDFAGTSAPAGWALCNGQALSRTTYAALFAVIGTTYGAPDGSTFSLPDLRGRVVAGFDAGNVTARLNGAYAGGVNAAVLGAGGGEQAHTSTAAETPPLSSFGLIATSTSGSSVSGGVFGGTGQSTLNITGGGNPAVVGSGVIAVATTTTTTMSGSINATGGAAHNNVQPTIILNKIIRISYDV